MPALMLDPEQQPQHGPPTLKQRLEDVLARMAAACARTGRPAGSAKLVAVTKSATAAQIREIAALGVRDFGENRVQVLESHIASAGELGDVRWHMIGHLQRNKVRQLLPMIASIQSLDSVRLADEIEVQAAKIGRRIPVLIEVNAGEELQKYGARPDDVLSLAKHAAALPHIEPRGIMSMAPLTEDAGVIRATFARARAIFEHVRQMGVGGDTFTELSMGMSGDFEIAIEEGATIVRIGSLLFAPGA